MSQYTITVRFDREESDDLDVTGGVPEYEGLTDHARLLAQFARELQTAYGDAVGMGGHWRVIDTSLRITADARIGAIKVGHDFAVEEDARGVAPGAPQAGADSAVECIKWQEAKALELERGAAEMLAQDRSASALATAVRNVAHAEGIRRVTRHLRGTFSIALPEAGSPNATCRVLDTEDHPKPTYCGAPVPCVHHPKGA